jgi:hypothetical protein
MAAMPSTPPKQPPERGLVDAAYFPLSGMNVAFKREAVPYMLFLPNFRGPDAQFFRRHDDIWGGYILQKCADLFGGCLSYGNKPTVFHDTDVDAEADAKEEIPMLHYEDAFVGMIDRIFAENRGGLLKYRDNPYVVMRTIAESLSDEFANLRPALEFQADLYLTDL